MRVDQIKNLVEIWSWRSLFWTWLPAKYEEIIYHDQYKVVEAAKPLSKQLIPRMRDFIIASWKKFSAQVIFSQVLYKPLKIINTIYWKETLNLNLDQKVNACS